MFSNDANRCRDVLHCDMLLEPSFCHCKPNKFCYGSEIWVCTIALYMAEVVRYRPTRTPEISMSKLDAAKDVPPSVFAAFSLKTSDCSFRRFHSSCLRSVLLLKKGICAAETVHIRDDKKKGIGEYRFYLCEEPCLYLKSAATRLMLTLRRR